MLTIIHSGQTGVERGAYRAARQHGFAIGGVCGADGRDEFGKLDPEVAGALLRGTATGAREVAFANLALASFVVIAVPNAALPRGVPGIAAIVRAARRAEVPSVVIDPMTAPSEVADIYRQIHEVRAGAGPDHGTFRLFVTGPRETRWATGERFGFQFVSGLVPVEQLAIG